MDCRKIVIDFDGVLTDGKHYVDHTGKRLFVSLSSRDTRAIKELIADGWIVYIITASSSEIIRNYAQNIGVDLIVQRNKALVDIEGEFIAVVDDVWDVPLIQKSSKSYCPCDADRVILNMEKITVLPVKGGNGVIAHLVNGLC